MSAATVLRYVDGRWGSFVVGGVDMTEAVDVLEIVADPESRMHPVIRVTLRPNTDVDLGIVTDDPPQIDTGRAQQWLADQLDELDTSRLAGELTGGMSQDPVTATVAALAEWLRNGALR